MRSNFNMGSWHPILFATSASTWTWTHLTLSLDSPFHWKNQCIIINLSKLREKNTSVAWVLENLLSRKTWKSHSLLSSNSILTIASPLLTKLPPEKRHLLTKGSATYYPGWHLHSSGPCELEGQQAGLLRSSDKWLTKKPFGMMVYTCNSSYWKGRGRRIVVQDQPSQNCVTLPEKQTKRQ
jgi:hypothetical protein